MINPAGSTDIDESRIAKIAYRPLDGRYLFNHSAFGDFLRPGLQAAWGANNVGFYCLPSGTGRGAAVWCHGSLPDYHSFRGSYGGYAFPLNDRRAGHGPSNVSADLLDGLALAYKHPVTPEAAFDAILGLLSATSYTLRFAEDLEDVFPHVPFPASREVFEQAVAIGREIREVETFARPPLAAYLTPVIARIDTTPHGPLATIGPNAWNDGGLVLCENGSGKVSGISTAVWSFAVSGYPLLPRWLAGREGISVDDAFIKEFRDITGRINELIHCFDEADLVLQQALTHSLTRDDLGLPPDRDEAVHDQP